MIFIYAQPGIQVRLGPYLNGQCPHLSLVLWVLQFCSE